MYQACHYLLCVCECIAQENFYSLLENEGVKESDEVMSSGLTDSEVSHQTENDHYQETTAQSPSAPSALMVEDNVHCSGDTEVDAAECDGLDVPLYAVPDKVKSKVR